MCSQVSEGPWGWAHPAHLPKPGQHDDDGGVVLPQHAPEVLGALCQRPLCGYVGLLLSGVDIRLDMLEVLCSPSLPKIAWSLGAPLRSPLLREAHSNLLGWPYSVVPPASQPGLGLGPHTVWWADTSMLTYSHPGSWH